MSLTKQDVEHIARLARLELSDAEKDEYTGQLNKILHLMEKLNELDTTGIEPTAHAIRVQNVFRQDVVQPSMDPEAALANAPDRADNYFKVPKILEQ